MRLYAFRIFETIFAQRIVSLNNVTGGVLYVKISSVEKIIKILKIK